MSGRTQRKVWVRRLPLAFPVDGFCWRPSVRRDPSFSGGTHANRQPVLKRLSRGLLPRPSFRGHASSQNVARLSRLSALGKVCLPDRRRRRPVAASRDRRKRHVAGRVEVPPGVWVYNLSGRYRTMDCWPVRGALTGPVAARSWWPGRRRTSVRKVYCFACCQAKSLVKPWGAANLVAAGPDQWVWMTGTRRWAKRQGERRLTA